MKLNFALFRNDKKQGNQPDMRSPMNTPIQIQEPGEYRVAGWFKEKDGKKYLSCILEKVVPGQDMGPTREQNVAMIQKTRQVLEDNLGPVRPAQGYQAPQGGQPRYDARPTQPPRYPNPQRPPDPADDLPF